MELITVSFDPAQFDKLVHSGLAEHGDMTFAFKDDALVSGDPGFVVSFTVNVGRTPHRVQAVNTVKNLLLMAAGVAAKYPEICQHLGIKVTADKGYDPNSGQTSPN